MRLALKINNVEGQDDQKRHILLVDDESLREAMFDHEGWLTQNVVKDFLLKKKPTLLSEIIQDPNLRNVIYMQEKVKREQKAENRKRMKQEEIEKQRRREQFIASSNYRRSVDYIKGVLRWDQEEQ